MWTHEAQVELDQLNSAIEQAARFIEVGAKFRNDMETARRANGWSPSPSKARAATRRASLDLTSSLAELRRRRG